VRGSLRMRTRATACSAGPGQQIRPSARRMEGSNPQAQSIGGKFVVQLFPLNTLPVPTVGTARSRSLLRRTFRVTTLPDATAVPSSNTTTPAAETLGRPPTVCPSMRLCRTRVLMAPSRKIPKTKGVSGVAQPGFVPAMCLSRILAPSTPGSTKPPVQLSRTSLCRTFPPGVLDADCEAVAGDVVV
jgi:hypothetical protein